MKKMIKKFSCFSNSIKFKLIVAYSSITTVTILIFLIIMLWRSGSVVYQITKQYVEQTIVGPYQALNSKIDSINADMLSFQTKKEVQDILTTEIPGDTLHEIEVLENALMDIDMFQRNITKLELYVLNRSNYPPPSAGGSVFSVEEMHNDLWFNNALKQGNSTGWSIRNNIDESKSFIVASKLITDVTTNRPVAVLKANINIRNFTNIISDVTLADTGRLFISSANHLIDYDKSQVGGYLVNDKLLFNDMLKSNKSETRSAILGGEKYLVSTYPIKNTGLFLIGAVKIKEFSSTQKAISFAVIFAAFALLLSLLFIWFISITITKPISDLTTAMHHYEPGTITPLKSNANDEIGVLFSIFNDMQITIKDLLDNIEHESNVRKYAELKALQAQITPHFLYNTLNSICVLAKKYNAKDIQQMIMALSKFFMISLSNGAELITIEKELEQVRSYMYIQKIRYADRFALHTDVPKDLMNNLICKLTLQPLVENCINHAFTELDDIGIIEIAAIREGDDIVITVSDNGPEGLSDIDELNRYVNKQFEINEPIEKYGIHNINQRIHLHFGDDYGLSYKLNKPNGLTAVVRIKALTKEDS